MQTHAGADAPIDLSQFARVFFDEAGEHLAELERLLLTIDVGNPDDESLNAIFRAAHSVKGGAATFGFADIAAVTHELETLLDRIRKHELALKPEMVDAFLAAGDVLASQLAKHRGESTESIDPTDVVARLKSLTTGDAAAPKARRVRIEFTPDANADLEKVLLGIRDSLAFVAASDSIVIDDGSAKETLPPTPSQGRGSSDDGFGFFDDAPGQPVEAKKDDGFGFFDGAPGKPENTPAHDAALNPGRRASDQPDFNGGVVGRRGHDKHLVPAQGDSSSIRVSVPKVDQMINLVGELVITQAMLAQKVAKLGSVQGRTLANGMGDLERNTRDLQESVMSIRMLPMSFVFNRFPRMVRDLAGKLAKQVELKTVGESTELDKGVIEKIADPMTHLVRNSVDHGIETPEARVAAGKPEQGTVTLSARHQGGHIVIEVADDGRGLDRAKLIAKAKERGLEASDAMSDAEAFNLIFEPGFSTAEKVTDVSGRGVGMDVVRRNIQSLGGSVEISSALGHGTRITVRLPLTLAIMDGMAVTVGGETCIIPLNSVVELLRPGAKDIRGVSGQGNVVEVRNEFLPVVDLAEALGATRDTSRIPVLVIIEVDGVKTALFVDELVGQQQVVVKSLESNYKRVPGVSGATILGDGTVALIVDVAAAVKLARH
ncbi:hypothetical protein BWI17_17805 [Betaproteobacteria bacterium GR16-43]|nr:hypothetical protein BWI17_17805 [Betaproteobacteria bacterium GR16-43]